MIQIEMSDAQAEVLMESLVVTAAMLEVVGKHALLDIRTMRLVRAQERAVCDLGKALAESKEKRIRYAKSRDGVL